MLSGMRFTLAAPDLSPLCPPTAFRFAGEHIDPLWIEDALAATGTASIRRRKLPANLVIWLVIAMALFRDRSIAAVVSHLGLARDKEAPGGRGQVVPAAIAQARQRVGDKPLAVLFDRTAKAWTESVADRDRWRGLAVFALDGTCLLVQDTPENLKTFGKPKAARGRGEAAYPQVRLAALTAPRSHMILALSPGSYATSEVKLARPMWDRLPDQSLLVADRGFIDYPTLFGLQARGHGRHWLVRAKKNLRWTVVENLADGDDLVEIKLPPAARRAHPHLPKARLVRAIRYQRPGFQPQTLLTSLTDDMAYPAAEIVALYHERWEIELGFDEKKTHLLERRETLRSKTATGVLQEVWGLAIAYNLIRLMMTQVAEQAHVAPRRISFWNAVLLIRNFAVTAWDVAPGTLPALLRTLTRDLRLLVLPERRPRSNPRVVKIKMSNFPRKPPRATAEGPK